MTWQWTVFFNSILFYSKLNFIVKCYQIVFELVHLQWTDSLKETTLPSVTHERKRRGFWRVSLIIALVILSNIALNIKDHHSMPQHTRKVTEKKYIIYYIENSWATVTLLENAVKVEVPYFLLVTSKHWIWSNEIWRINEE